MIMLEKDNKSCDKIKREPSKRSTRYKTYK